VVLAEADDVSLEQPKLIDAPGCDVTWRPDSKELAVVDSDDGCTEPVGRVVRFLTSDPKKVDVVTAKGRNPNYKPAT
jgi:hypothetical protein